MIIAIDYDDTIVKCDFPRAGTEMPGAIETLGKMQDAGHFIILWTCREDEPLRIALDFLKEKGFTPDAVNEHDPAAVKRYLEVHPGMKISRKIYAHLYIDDKHLGGIPDWPRIGRMVLEGEL